MKKIFTLLFCVVALGFAAHANDEVMIDECINLLLTQDQPTATRAANFDLNNDGIISVVDLTMMIDRNIEAKANRAPAQQTQNDKVQTVINEALETTTGQPDIEDVNKVIEKNLKKQQ